MNLTHIDPGDVIKETAALYKKIKGRQTDPAEIFIFGPELSRQVQALAYVLTEQINDALLEIENASDS